MAKSETVPDWYRAVRRIADIMARRVVMEGPDGVFRRDGNVIKRPTAVHVDRRESDADPLHGQTEGVFLRCAYVAHEPIALETPCGEYMPLGRVRGNMQSDMARVIRSKLVLTLVEERRSKGHVGRLYAVCGVGGIELAEPVALPAREFRPAADALAEWRRYRAAWGQAL